MSGAVCPRQTRRVRADPLRRRTPPDTTTKWNASITSERTTESYSKRANSASNRSPEARETRPQDDEKRETDSDGRKETSCRLPQGKSETPTTTGRAWRAIGCTGKARDGPQMEGRDDARTRRGGQMQLEKNPLGRKRKERESAMYKIHGHSTCTYTYAQIWTTIAVCMVKILDGPYWKYLQFTHFRIIHSDIYTVIKGLDLGGFPRTRVGIHKSFANTHTPVTRGMYQAVHGYISS